ncbi:hypothetical protein Tco_1211150 [Tanacetum coccineum]
MKACNEGVKIYGMNEEGLLKFWSCYLDRTSIRGSGLSFPEFLLGFAAALAVLVTGASQSRQHESRKSPTKSLFDVGSRRISIFTVNTKEYHSDVLAIITRIMRTSSISQSALFPILTLPFLYSIILGTSTLSIMDVSPRTGHITTEVQGYIGQEYSDKGVPQKPGVDGPHQPIDTYLAQEAPPAPDYCLARRHHLHLLHTNIPRSQSNTEFMPPEDHVFPAEEQPLPAVVSPTADSSGYIPEEVRLCITDDGRSGEAIEEIAPTTIEGVNRNITDLSTTFDQETTIMHGLMEDARDDRREGELGWPVRSWGYSMDVSDDARSTMCFGTTLLKGLQTQMAEFQRQQGPAEGPAQPDAPEEAGLRRPDASCRGMHLPPEFLKSNALNFKALREFWTTRWFEKNGVWNAHVKTTTPEAAHAMPWATLKKKMTDKYCPRGEIKKIEAEMWNLKVKGTDVVAYNRRFNEQAVDTLHEQPEFSKQTRGKTPEGPMPQGMLTGDNTKDPDLGVLSTSQKNANPGANQGVMVALNVVPGTYSRGLPKLKNNNNRGESGWKCQGTDKVADKHKKQLYQHSSRSCCSAPSLTLRGPDSRILITYVALQKGFAEATLLMQKETQRRFHNSIKFGESLFLPARMKRKKILVLETNSYDGYESVGDSLSIDRCSNNLMRDWVAILFIQIVEITYAEYSPTYIFEQVTKTSLIGHQCRRATLHLEVMLRNINISSLPSEAFRRWCATPLSTLYPPTTAESSSGDSSERPLHSSSHSARPSRKRCRSLVDSVPSSMPVMGSLAPTHAGLLPPRKRFRDSYSSEASIEEDTEIDPIKTGVDMELGIGDGDDVRDHDEIDPRDVRDDTEGYEADTSARDTVEVGIDPMSAPIVEEEIVEPAGEDPSDSSGTRDGIVRSFEDMPIDLDDVVRDFYHHMSEVRIDRIVGIETAQRRLEADQLIARGQRVSMIERIDSLRLENLKVRAMLDIERDRVNSLRLHMSLSHEEFRQVRRDRDDTRGRLRRLESYVERRLGFRP